MESILFGVLQGILEWLPISSTGELVLVMTSFFEYAAEDAVSLSFFLHIGTALSAVLYFRRDIAGIIAGLKGYRPNFKDRNGLPSFLIVSTLLSGSLGFLIFSALPLESASGEMLMGLVGAALIATGLVQRLAKRSGTRTQKDMRLPDSLLLGAVQAFSVVPGLSRSGITVSALLLRGYKASDALRLSFLMGIPAVLGAQLGIALTIGIPGIPAVEMAAGIAASFLAGYIFIGFLLRIAGKVPFWIFAVMLGSIALIALAFALA